MDISGERRIPAPGQKVWEALHDPRVLKTLIPGCERIEKPAEFEYRVEAGAAPERFMGTVSMRESDPDGRSVLHIQGHGPAGPVDADATIRLTHEGRFTWLGYEVHSATQQEADTKALIHRVLDALVAEVAGTEEKGADGLAAAISALGSPGRIFRQEFAAVQANTGIPASVWVGSLIWLAAVLLIASAYF